MPGRTVVANVSESRCLAALRALPLPLRLSQPDSLRAERSWHELGRTCENLSQALLATGPFSVLSPKATRARLPPERL